MVLVNPYVCLWFSLSNFTLRLRSLQAFSAMEAPLSSATPPLPTPVAPPPTVENVQHPSSIYFLHPNENPSLILVSTPLIGLNYHSWARTTKMSASCPKTNSSSSIDQFLHLLPPILYFLLWSIVTPWFSHGLHVTWNLQLLRASFGWTRPMKFGMSFVTVSLKAIFSALRIFRMRFCFWNKAISMSQGTSSKWKHCGMSWRFFVLYLFVVVPLRAFAVLSTMSSLEACRSRDQISQRLKRIICCHSFSSHVTGSASSFEQGVFPCDSARTIVLNRWWLGDAFSCKCNSKLFSTFH